VRRKRVSSAVPGQKRDPSTRETPENQVAGRRAIWRVNAHDAAGARVDQLVEARAADDTDDRFCCTHVIPFSDASSLPTRCGTNAPNPLRNGDERALFLDRKLFRPPGGIRLATLKE
jgi:hypothetical protein